MNDSEFNQKTKAILISLGGTPAPLIYSLNHQKPDYICFFVSEESKSSIDKDILPRLDFKPKHHDWIVTPSAESLSECFRVISKELPRILKKWEVESKDVVEIILVVPKPCRLLLSWLPSNLLQHLPT